MVDRDQGKEVERTRRTEVRAGLPGVFGITWSGEKRWTERATRLGERIQALTGQTADELEATAEADDRVADAADLVVERVARRGDDDYAEALARALAAAFGDTAEVDGAAYLCAELANLEPAHLRGLRAFTVSRSLDDPDEARRTPDVTPRTIAEAAGVPRAMGRSICAQLDAAGILERAEVRVSNPPTRHPKGFYDALDDEDLQVQHSDTWNLTEWGDHVLLKLLEGWPDLQMRGCAPIPRRSAP